MKIAVPYDNGNIFQHFGKAKCFKIYDIENKEIISTELVDTMGKKGHVELPSMLAMLNVDAVVCGRIGAKAKIALDNDGISLYNGCIGNADKAVNSFIFGDMVFENS